MREVSEVGEAPTSWHTSSTHYPPHLAAGSVLAGPWHSLPARCERTHLRLSILIRQSFLTLINLVRRRDLDPIVRAATGLEPSHVAATGGR
jgi:hypothetical protein